MPKYKITSGEYELTVEGETPRKAADLAIQVHHNGNHPSALGIITMVETLDRRSKPNGTAVFFATEQLLERNTPGLGDGEGQYSRKD